MNPRLDAITTHGRPRIVLYSHDTQGLGHLRRNLLIARTLCGEETTPVILLLSGLREAAAFAMPKGVDCLTLPSLGKGADGQYFPRSLCMPMQDLIDVRRRAIEGVLDSFRPDVMIVDKVPGGAFGELIPSLEHVRRDHGTRLVLGVREILDAPDVVRREWEEGGYVDLIREYYDRLWVYGDRTVYDAPSEYKFPADVAAITRFTGYLAPTDLDGDGGRHEELLASLGVPDGPMTLCVVGGGRDGLPLAESFLDARLPDGASGVLVTGPLMPEPERRRLRELAGRHPRRYVLEFVTNPVPLLERADRVIAMGGYNTTCEIVSLRRRALIVPRIEPRSEQLIRARRFADRGLVDMLHPRDLSAEALGAWLAEPPKPRPTTIPVDLDGARRLPRLLDELLAVTPARKGTGHAAG